MLGTKWKPGDRLPPVRLLAQMLKTGRSATHQALKMLADEGLLTAKPSIGTLVCEGVQPVDEQTDQVDLELRRRNVVVLYAKFESTIIDLANNVRDLLSRRGFSATADVFNIWSQEHAVAKYAGADALVLINPRSDLPIRTTPGQQLLVVTSASDQVILNEGCYDVVETDGRYGGLLAGSHLKKLDADPVCFVGMRNERTGRLDRISAARLEGLALGLGHEVADENVVLASAYTMEHGAEIVPALMGRTPRPTGVFCASDELAMGVAIGALGAGLKAGRDFQLIGFDGQERGRMMHGGPLTTVMLPWHDMAVAATELLERRLREPARPVQRLRIGGSLFEGATTRRALPDGPQCGQE